jgi:hypothetical protein
MHAFVIGTLVVFAVAAPPPAPAQDAPPVIDIALRQIRASSGGSSIARSMVRDSGQSFLYAGLGPCIIGASDSDRAQENSVTWRASGTVRSVERGIAVADVEWQRIEYRPAGIVAGPRVRMTLTLPLGERVAVDFVDASGSTCRADGLIFEVGVAPDHGWRLAMSAEGRLEAAGSSRAGGGGGGGRGVPDSPELIERRRQGAEAARAATVVTRPMPPRQYSVDVWLVPGPPGASSTAQPLAQRLSRVIGGTGGRFEFPPVQVAPVLRGGPHAIEISALVIPVSGDALIVAITRHVTSSDGGSPVSVGWLRAIPMPTPGDVPSFEIPAPEPDVPTVGPRQGLELRVKVATAGKSASANVPQWIAGSSASRPARARTGVALSRTSRRPCGFVRGPAQDTEIDTGALNGESTPLICVRISMVAGPGAS